MTQRSDHLASSRRAFLRFLAGSPFFSLLPACSASEGRSSAAADSGTAGDLDPIITSPEQAINVFDLEAVARQNLPPAHFGYIQTGVLSDATLRANTAAYGKYYLRPRRLVDVSSVNSTVRLFGREWPTPIIMAPAGSQRAFHADGELASARAAQSKGHLQILSSVSSTSVEDVAQAHGEPVWYQLYPTGRWDVTQRLLRRAEGAGSPVVVLTVDIPGPAGNRETLERASRRDTRDCSTCHGTPLEDRQRKPMYQGTTIAPGEWSQSGLTWDVLRRLRDDTRMKLVVKGIVTAEDARRCRDAGVDGIIVSNHGGRAEESGRATLDSLTEVVEAIDGRIPVLMDGGIRRGTDIIKALAFGADAVCIGRPYLWGLGAFGQAGVERTLELLRAELQSAMQFVGAPTLNDIDRSLVGRA